MKRGTLLFCATLLACAPTATTIDDTLSETEDALASFTALVWPTREVPYRFEDEVAGLDRLLVLGQMIAWEDAVTTVHDGVAFKGLTFTYCDEACTDAHVTIKYTATPTASGMSCSGETLETRTLKISYNPNPRVLQHELGHCIGLIHEHQRVDRDRWLVEGTFDYDFKGNGVISGTYDTDQFPILSNYDYDSTMLAASRDGILRFTDQLGNEFSGAVSSALSAKDASRILQYYARVEKPTWGFFESLSTYPANEDALPDPTLAPGVDPVGSPAIALQSTGNYDIFVRGTNQNIYWKPFRNDVAGAWSSIGCCFDSDPGAVSWSNGRIHVAATVAGTGLLAMANFHSDMWSTWSFIPGAPSGGIAASQDGGRIGPGLASRGHGMLDVFVAGPNAMSTASYANGSWGAWSVLSTSYRYRTDARPAAVALDSTRVRLAANLAGRLYEPLVTYSGSTPSFSVGSQQGTMAAYTPAAIARRDSTTAPYRVLITNLEGRISHRFSNGTWRDIGGIPLAGTGPAAVGFDQYGALIVMTGEEQRGCVTNCVAGFSPNPGGVIQSGGVWLRQFE